LRWCPEKDRGSHDGKGEKALQHGLPSAAGDDG
jgi:hypothetical protein